MNHSDFWTPEREQIVRDMWAANHRPRDIAAQIGCTKNAVIGKVNRLNLPTRSGDERKIYLRKPSNAKPKSPTMTVDERIAWAFTVRSRMEKYAIKGTHLAVVFGGAPSHISRLLCQPDKYSCTHEFKRRVEEGLATIIERKGKRL